MHHHSPRCASDRDAKVSQPEGVQKIGEEGLKLLKGRGEVCWRDLLCANLKEKVCRACERLER